MSLEGDLVGSLQRRVSNRKGIKGTIRTQTIFVQTIDYFNLRFPLFEIQVLNLS